MKSLIAAKTSIHWQAPATLRAHVILLASIGIACFTVTFIRWADAPGLVVATWRVVIATILLSVPFFRQPPAQRRLDRFTVRWGVAGGILFALVLGSFHIALNYTTAANATFLDSIAPLWVGLITLFVLRRSLPRLFWPGVGVALAGAALVLAGAGMSAINPGDLIVLGESAIWAVYLVVTGEARAQIGTLTWTWLTMVVSAVGLLLLSLLLGLELGGYGPRTTLTILWSGVLAQVVGFLGVSYALGHIPAARVSVMYLIKPIGAAAVAYLLLSESFGGWRLLGGGLVLLGVYLVNRPDRIPTGGEGK